LDASSPNRWLLFVVTTTVLSPVVTQAQVWHGNDPPQPLLVPVTTSTPPYSPDAIWRAIAAGDTTSLAFRWKYNGGSCVNQDFFLSREIHEYVTCSPALLTPWLQVGSAVLQDPRELLRAVIQHSLAHYSLLAFADTDRVIHALLVATPNMHGRPRTIPLDTLLVLGPDTVRLRSLVLIPLPRDSLRLSESLLIDALPEVFGLAGELLAHDRMGVLHIRTDALLRLGKLRRVRLDRDTTLVLDAAVRLCGDLNCIALNPALEWRILGDPPGVLWFLRVAPDEGLVVESLDTTRRPSRNVPPTFRTRQLLRINESAQQSVLAAAMGGTTVPVLRVTWNDGVATVRLHAAPPL